MPKPKAKRPTTDQRAFIASCQRAAKQCAETMALVEDGNFYHESVESWPLNSKGKPVDLFPASEVTGIAVHLIDRVECFKHLQQALKNEQLSFLYARRRVWEKDGKTILGMCKRITGVHRHHTGYQFTLLFNWTVWSRIDARQKVSLVYHELRHAAPGGYIYPHDAELFFDELLVFGVDTYMDWKALDDVLKVTTTPSRKRKRAR